MKDLIVKPRVNKKNGQINFSMPRKKISMEDLDKIIHGKKIKMKWGFEKNG